MSELAHRVEEMEQNATDVTQALFDRRTTDCSRIRVRYLINKIEQGWSPECEDREPEAEEWGVLKLGCVNAGVFTHQAKALATGLSPRLEHLVTEGDVLMSRANTRELVGSCAVVTSDVRARTMLSDLLYRLTPSPRRCSSEFLAMALGAPSARRQIEAVAMGSAGSMPKLPQRVIKQLTVPSVEVGAQQALLRELDDESSPLLAVRREGEALRNGLVEYRDALITEAVTGKLDVSRLSDQQMDESAHAAMEGDAPEVLSA
jgi:type I restriction enzyme S subunit